uniref:RRAD and GEM like GTPase 2 n=1 Tax=Oryctolagus cuniculus TaxID=9986 RepID=G1SF25_RABIT
MHTDLDTDMDTDTETTALCPSGSHKASPPGTPTPEADATLLKKPEKLLAGLARGGPPSAPGVPRRRGSMPVPYKHQLRRAQAVDELDWPTQASSSGSSDSLGSGDAGSAPKDGIFKIMLVGESGVGKSTLAGTFGGLQGDSAHELENPGGCRGVAAGPLSPDRGCLSHRLLSHRPEKFLQSSRDPPSAAGWEAPPRPPGHPRGKQERPGPLPGGVTGGCVSH